MLRASLNAAKIRGRSYGKSVSVGFDCVRSHTGSPAARRARNAKLSALGSNSCCVRREKVIASSLTQAPGVSDVSARALVGPRLNGRAMPVLLDTRHLSTTHVVYAAAPARNAGDFPSLAHSRTQLSLRCRFGSGFLTAKTPEEERRSGVSVEGSACRGDVTRRACATGRLCKREK